jgi:hypothetical protein
MVGTWFSHKWLTQMMIFKEKNMKKLFRTGFMTALAVILTSGWCFAATIMFPYINSNPGNLSTIVSVINTANPVGLGCLPTETLELHYRYMTKEVTASAIDACMERDFSRPSTQDDLVTFDAAGDLNGGDAMFNDVTDYNGGAGAPGFDLPNMGLTDARRGFLLVNHRCSALGEVPAAMPGALDGEVMLLDVVNGAAWGYQAIVADQTAAGLGQNYAFAQWLMGAVGFNPVIGATTELLAENITTQLAQPDVVIYPPDEFQTRFFVTPLIINTTTMTAGTAGNDMSQVAANDQKRTRIQLLDSNGIVGVTDRDEAAASGGGPVHVRCVAGIDLNDLTGGSFGPWYDAQGGWATVDLRGPASLDPEIAGEVIVVDDYCAIIFKLQFGSPSFANGMINSSSIIRSDRIED